MMASSSVAGPPHKKRRYADQASGPSSTHDDGFGTQSLPVAVLPDDFSGDPLDGEQYLAVVRREAAAAPGIFFAAHNPYADTNAVASTSAIPLDSLPDSVSTASASTQLDDGLLMPSSEWKSTFTQQFRNAREALSNTPTEPVKLTKDDLPKINNTNAWYAWIHGRPPPPTSPEEVEKQSGKAHEWRIREPSAALLLRLNTEQILGLLETFPYWIAHRVSIPDGQARMEERREGEVLQPLHARWLFALLLRLDGRLVSEEISTLRTLARACVAAITLSRIRRKAVRSRVGKAEAAEVNGTAEAGEKSTEMREEESMRRDEAGAWMVVAIIAGVWGQSDLWDDAIVDMKRVSS
ncbi:Gem-associated protein 2 [Kalmanozyma brasiliensis GHG001]|uniref:Uncharacterized protein n=1 Tax=Kalmanozyma brasiliensis (strain GHG001) TaxID=1365824 RepID=V5EUX0_KALBG|nr:Gem-associated protein 2 [Kalmanozyma brasiliensis GHG001]EST06988.1 Gem-associated protein 2 [Kalmanozyma brasiliensis GHG001]